MGAAWCSAAQAVHALAVKLSASAAHVGAYLPFLPAAAAALQSVPLPTLDLAGAHLLLPLVHLRCPICAALDLRSTLT